MALWMLAVFLAAAPTVAPQTRTDDESARLKRDAAVARFAYARTLQRVPFDPDLLLQDDWRTRLAGAFDSMSELKGERQELSGKLEGVYLAGTLVLPEKIVATGDVLILARRVVFLGQNVMIVGPGKNVGLFAIDAIAQAKGADTEPSAKRHVSIFTGSLMPRSPDEEDLMREARALLCASGGPLDSCDPWKDGYNGLLGEPGANGADGSSGSTGANGEWGSCQGNRDGLVGEDGHTGRDGDNGGNAGHGSEGGRAGDVDCPIPALDDGTYDFWARGGNGGQGGRGGNGGNGGDGGNGGAGGKGVGHCSDCSSGRGGPGGHGGWGGRAGRGGNGGVAGSGGNGGHIRVRHCRATVRPHYESGRGGAGGEAGYAGGYGAAGGGGGGGRGGTACGYTSPDGQDGGHGQAGAGNDHGQHGYPAGNGNNGTEDIARYDGCDDGGGGGGCDDSPDTPLEDCCPAGDDDICNSDPSCHYIYTWCECWCPSERPQQFQTKKPKTISELFR
jgi:hypothetical protein